MKSFFRTSLYWEKVQGCRREFGVWETVRRTCRELSCKWKEPGRKLDISPITKEVAIGAAPRSLEAIQALKRFEIGQVIDLRAERKSSDILGHTKEIAVKWIPTLDDWKPKPREFFRRLDTEIQRVLSGNEKILLCCGAGEHRAPLAGVVALVNLGYSTETAMAVIQRARPQAEFLPVYKSSLKEYLAEIGA